MKFMKINPMLLCDSYKISHRRMMEKGCTLLYSNITARKSRIQGVDKVVVFGIQYFIKEYLIERFNNDFFNLPKEEVIASFKRITDSHLGKDSVPIDHIEQLHDLGYLPLKIKALKEGVQCPIGVPLCTIVNTHPDFAWLTNYIETISQNVIWRCITSATDMLRFRQLGDRFAQETSSNPGFVDYQFHTFAMRGNDGLESACLCDAGHLLSFKGSDTVPTIMFMEEYYGANCDKEVISVSVPANEHAIVSSYGRTNEFELFKHLITEVHPDGILSLVSDTYDLTEIINPDNGVLAKLKDSILNRNGKIVVRPDSSDKTPLEIICGDNEPESKYNDRQRPIIEKGLIRCLDEIFGHTVNEKGYKELHPNIGCIYGEQISYELAEKILEKLKEMGYASTNVVFGIGSWQHMGNRTRGTFELACKATYCETNGVGINITKDPITDDGMKKSHSGLMRVNKDFSLEQECTWEQESGGLLETVFENGKMVRIQTLSEIRGILNER